MVSDAVIKHIKTHTERSSDDQAAVDFLKNQLKSHGKSHRTLQQWINGQI